MQMSNSDLKTSVLRERVMECRSMEEFTAQILPLLNDQKESWKQKVLQILSNYPGSNSAFAKTLGISRQAVSKWKKHGDIPSREMMLRIGLACGYDPEEIDGLLCRYGRYTGLYSKSLEDCACIFVCKKYREPKERIEKFAYIIDAFKQTATDEKDTDIRDIDTRLFDRQLAAVESEDDLARFIMDNTAVFSSAYHKVYAWLEAEVQAALKYQPELFRQLNEEYHRNQAFYDNLGSFSLSQGWSDVQKRIIYDILNHKKWYPTRNRLLITGVYLNYNTADMDDLLAMAHMEPVCSKTPVEAVLIFVNSECDRRAAKRAPGEELDPYSEFFETSDVLTELTRQKILQLPEDFVTEFIEKEDLEDDESEKEGELPDCD